MKTGSYEAKEGPWAIRRKTIDGVWFMAGPFLWHHMKFARRFQMRDQAVRYLARYLKKWPSHWDEVTVVRLVSKKAVSS